MPRTILTIANDASRCTVDGAPATAVVGLDVAGSGGAGVVWDGDTSYHSVEVVCRFVLRADQTGFHPNDATGRHSFQLDLAAADAIDAADLNGVDLTAYCRASGCLPFTRWDDVLLAFPLERLFDLPDYLLNWNAENVLTFTARHAAPPPGFEAYGAPDQAGAFAAIWIFTQAFTQADPVATWGANDRGQLADGTTTDNGLPTINLPAAGHVSAGAGEPTAVAVQRDLAGIALSLVSVVDGGAGYGVGDTITLAGGTYADPVVLTVATVDAGGAVLTVSATDRGDYSDPPLPPINQASASGTGSGATFFASWFAGTERETDGYGDDAAGQLSQGAADASAHPTPLILLRPSRWTGHTSFTYPFTFSRVWAGADHFVGLDGLDYVWSWGAGDRGQLGDGASADSAEPVPMKYFGVHVEDSAPLQANDLDSVFVGDGFTVVRPRDAPSFLCVVGTVPGIGTYSTPKILTTTANPDYLSLNLIPAASTILLPLPQQGTAPRHCVVKLDSTWYRFGANDYGQLLTGGTSVSVAPQSFTPPSGFPNADAALALGPDSTTWIVSTADDPPDSYQVWGVGRPHPLGDADALSGGLAYAVTPTRIPFTELTEDDTLEAIYAGRGHRMVLRRRTGAVFDVNSPETCPLTWWTQGWNDRGQLGNGGIGGHEAGWSLALCAPELGSGYLLRAAANWDSTYAPGLPFGGLPWAALQIG